MLQERNTTARTALLGQTQPQAAGWHAPVHGPVLVPWLRDACTYRSSSCTGAQFQPSAQPAQAAFLLGRLRPSPARVAERGTRTRRRRSASRAFYAQRPSETHRSAAVPSASRSVPWMKATCSPTARTSRITVHRAQHLLNPRSRPRVSQVPPPLPKVECARHDSMPHLDVSTHLPRFSLHDRMNATWPLVRTSRHQPSILRKP